ncbi:MAG: GntR family transcriptional regulator [Bacteroidales bacterium]|nr:GntR family transcriptional regulator [Bacteroidales bacterium]MBQ5747840.1 GntR family transcriptional regulator [Bacteroidales bacterium]MBR4974748.1 GntR family transcriptional regulator [Bacteroidales bacterium]
MDFNQHKPIYLQIVEQIEDKILSGALKADERIDSVREMATALGVNPNTVMRSYEFLERGEVIYNKRGVGFFISTEAREKIKFSRKKNFLENEIPTLFAKMDLLEVDIEEVVNLYNQSK